MKMSKLPIRSRYERAYMFMREWGDDAPEILEKRWDEVYEAAYTSLEERRYATFAGWVNKQRFASWYALKEKNDPANWLPF